jgi:hypothetical protein
MYSMCDGICNRPCDGIRFARYTTIAKGPGSDITTNKIGQETSCEGLDMWLKRSNASSEDMFQRGLLRQVLSIG